VRGEGDTKRECSMRRSSLIFHRDIFNAYNASSILVVGWGSLSLRAEERRMVMFDYSQRCAKLQGRKEGRNEAKNEGTKE